MPTSIFIAKLLGPIYILVGIALLIRAQMFRTILQEFIRNPALVYLAGVLGLLGGLAVVLTHNVWVLDWRIIITLVGWVTVVRAVVTIFQPQQIVALGSKILERRGIFIAAAVMNLIIGLVLSYFGYSR
jgi:uncharacterized membrane protein